MTPLEKSGRHLLKCLNEVDAILTKAGMTPMSPWWRDVFTEWLTSPRPMLVVRKGRRAGGSTALARFVVVMACFAPFTVVPGEQISLPLVSTRRNEAASRLKWISEALVILGVPFEQVSDEIRIKRADGAHISIRVFSANTASMRGATAGGIYVDEAAFLQSDDSSNPFREILASALPCTLTNKHVARSIVASSALGTGDHHAELIDRGTDETQLVKVAATWEANDTITQEDCRRLEPNMRVFNREYASIPSDETGSAFDPDDIAAAIRKLPNAQLARGRKWIAIDAATSGGDDFAVGVFSWVDLHGAGDAYLSRTTYDEHGRISGNTLHTIDGRPMGQDPENWGPKLVCHEVRTFGQAERKASTMDAIIKKIWLTARRHDVSSIVGDQHSSMFLEQRFNALTDLRFKSVNYTNATKTEAVDMLRTLLAGRGVILPNNAELKRQLNGFNERITKTGLLTFGGRKDDLVAVLLTSLIADSQRLLSGSPYRASTVRSYGAGFSMGGIDTVNRG